MVLAFSSRKASRLSGGIAGSKGGGRRAAIICSANSAERPCIVYERVPGVRKIIIITRNKKGTGAIARVSGTMVSLFPIRTRGMMMIGVSMRRR